MDRGKRPNMLASNRNNKIYMDLKDIIREHALPFLPAKSLFKFQVVCRDWKLQISAPFFAHNQSLNFHAISGLFCQSPGDPPSFISADPNSFGVPDPSLQFLPVPVDIRASSNGLLCCQGRTGDKAYYICNPVTKQYKKLPKPNGDHGSEPAVVLVFVPSLLNFVAEYKLVCAFPSADFEATEFEIYSSADGSWKMCGEICFAIKKLVPSSGVHVNGVLYWQSKQTGILAYDLAKDRSQLIRLYYGHGPLGALNGKLCTAYANGRSMDGRNLAVAVLANAYSNTMQMHSNVKTWEEKHRFNLDNKVVGEVSSAQAVPMAIDGGLLFVQAGKRVYSYDVKTKRTVFLQSRAAPVSEMFCLPYVNSLVYL